VQETELVWRLVWAPWRSGGWPQEEEKAAEEREMRAMWRTFAGQVCSETTCKFFHFSFHVPIVLFKLWGNSLVHPGPVPVLSCKISSCTVCPRHVVAPKVHPQNFRFQNVRYQNVQFKTSETSGLQTIRFTKRQIYKTSGLQNVRLQNVKFQNVLTSNPNENVHFETWCFACHFEDLTFCGCTAPKASWTCRGDRGLVLII
jgi:hypothetical protein